MEVTAGILVKDHHVLLMRRAPGQNAAGGWEYPGGKIEPGETGEQCLPRELKEELCIIISDHTKSLYDDKWYGDTLHYTGMGKTGDQTLTSQNRTLAESDHNGVEVHLFEVLHLARHVNGTEKQKAAQRDVTSSVYVRDPFVAEYAKRRAKGICQLCGQPAPFWDQKGRPYLESHHIEWLSQGGADTTDNTAALCPNCHKKMHIVNDPEDVQKLRSAIG